MMKVMMEKIIKVRNVVRALWIIVVGILHSVPELPTVIIFMMIITRAVLHPIHAKPGIPLARKIIARFAMK
jgi:hypothetical protein